MSLTSVLKGFVKPGLIKLYIFVSRIREIFYLRSIRFLPFSNQPKVFIGFQNNKNSGGGLKLRDLKAFDSDDNKYNVLYLLSSSLPASFEVMIINAKKARSKIIWNQNGVGFPAWAGPNYMELNKSFKFGIESADIVIFQSYFALDSVDKLVFDTKKLTNKVVIHNAINISVFKPAYYKHGNSIRILVAGSHNDIIRVVLSVSILSLLRQAGIDCQLNIAGKIKKSSIYDVKNLIEKENLADYVTFLGEYGRNEAPEIFSSSDILLHLQPFDSCPTVVIEAMASAVVVVGPNNGAIPELLGEELSFQLVNNFTSYDSYDWGNPVEYKEKIISLIPMLDSLKRRARDRAVKYYDLENWVAAHNKLFYN
jgi:glycosyltransferase involved in cell wall biosynthesis